MVTLLNILHITDSHFGHQKVSTKFLVRNVVSLLLGIAEPEKLDRIVHTGDVFDSIISMQSDAGKEISYFVNFLLEFCHKYDIALIVVRGTGTHDGTQPEVFSNLNRARTNPVDLTYCDEICTFIDRDGYRWLAIPDEATPSAEQTQAEVEKLLKAEGISQVDFGATHSYYDFHAGAEHNPTAAFNSKFFNKRVKYIIFNGHIHNPSYRMGVLTGGSTDRNRHGEEEPKGIWNVSLLDDGKLKVEFIENKNAAKFITYSVVSTCEVEILKELNNYIVDGNRKYGRWWLRIRHPKSIPMTDILRELKKSYSDTVDITSIKDGDSEDNSWVGGSVYHQAIKEMPKFTAILPNTIMGLMSDKLKRMDISESEAEQHLHLFKEVIS